EHQLVVARALPWQPLDGGDEVSPPVLLHARELEAGARALRREAVQVRPGFAADPLGVGRQVVLIGPEERDGDRPRKRSTVGELDEGDYLAVTGPIGESLKIEIGWFRRRVPLDRALAGVKQFGPGERHGGGQQGSLVQQLDT